jgi:hypothetical protein
VRHWSGAHLGESFNVEVQDSPDEKAAKGKMKLQLRRDPATGRSVSEETLWKWRPGNDKADSLQHLKQSVQGRPGKDLRAERFPVDKKVKRQSSILSFSVSTPQKYPRTDEGTSD